MALELSPLPGLGQSAPQTAPNQGFISPDDIERRKRLAQALMMQATDASPVQHWTQALARAVHGFRGGLENDFARRDDLAARQGATATFDAGIDDILKGTGPGPAPAAPPAPSGTQPTATPPAAPPSAPGGQRVTSYSPQKGGDQMEGGYEAARPGPDGKALVRTLEDYRSGQSPYVTVAGNPAYYGKEYTIPQVSYTANGQRYTLSNVPAVVHDTGGAFKNAPEGRFDLPVGRDLGQADTNQGFNGVQFQPKNVQVASVGPMAYAPSGPSLPGAPALPPGADPIPPRPTGIPGAPAAQPALPGAPPISALQTQGQGTPPAASPAPAAVAPAQAPGRANGAPIDARTLAVAKLLMDPKVGPWLNDGQKALAAYLMRPTEPFTLAPGQTRFDGAGNVVAAAPQKGQFGLNPIWGTDEHNNPVPLQLGQDGAMVRSRIPEGVTIARDPEKVDTGTEILLVDRQTRQILSRIPKDVAGAAQQKSIGTAAGQAQAQLPGAEGMAAQIGQQVDALATDPYLPNMVGPIASHLPNVSPDAARVQARMDQLKGGVFLQGYQMLKGGGAITEVEGAKAENAMARLNAAQNINDYRAALAEFKDALTSGLAKLRAQGALVPGSNAGAQGQPPAPQSTQTPRQPGALAPGAVVNGFIYRGGNPNDANSWGRAQ